VKKTIKVFDEELKIDTEDYEHCETYDQFIRYVVAAGGLGMKIRGLFVTYEIFQNVALSGSVQVTLTPQAPVDSWGRFGFITTSGYPRLTIYFDRFSHDSTGAEMVRLDFVYEGE
jgi:hypothetical protein